MPLKDLKIPVKMTDDYRALEETMKQTYQLMSEVFKRLKEAATLMDKIKNAAMKPFDKD